MEVVLFQRQRKGRGKTVSGTRSLNELVPMASAAQFLADKKRQSLLQDIKAYSALEPLRYESLCAALIDNLISYCQNLPESTNSYYTHAGGLIDNALNRTEAALGLFQAFLIEEKTQLSEPQKLWQYALYSAALLQGIGKLFADFSVDLYDVNGQILNAWNPLLDSLVNIGSYYRYEFKKEQPVEFRRRLNLLLAKAIIPPSGFAWIASDADVLAVWLALLNEDQRAAGTLGAILIRADAIAIQRYLAELAHKATAGKTGPFGRAGTFSGGVPESVGEKEQIMGAEFIQWLHQCLEKGIIMINKAPLLMVPGGLLMCPEIFQLFIRDNPHYKNWQAMQKAFLSLGMHSRAADGSLNSRFEQTQNQQMHTGIVFSHYAVGLPASFKVHQLPTGKIEAMSATEFIHYAQENNHFIQRQGAAVEPLKKLSAAGIWTEPVGDRPHLQPGVKNSV